MEEQFQKIISIHLKTSKKESSHPETTHSFIETVAARRERVTALSGFAYLYQRTLQTFPQLINDINNNNRIISDGINNMHLCFTPTIEQLQNLFVNDKDVSEQTIPGVQPHQAQLIPINGGKNDQKKPSTLKITKSSFLKQPPAALSILFAAVGLTGIAYLWKRWRTIQRKSKKQVVCEEKVPNDKRPSY